MVLRVSLFRPESLLSLPFAYPILSFHHFVINDLTISFLFLVSVFIRASWRASFALFAYNCTILPGLCTYVQFRAPLCALVR